MSFPSITTPLHDRIEFADNALKNESSSLLSAAILLLVVSDYAKRQLPILRKLLREDDCLHALDETNYRQLVDGITYSSLVDVVRELRHFRHYHLLRSIFREIAGRATTEDTLATWSACADALILRAMAAAQEELSKRYGYPFEEASGSKAEIYVLAMGKLGGRELNFSSDIDLIIAFSGAGYTDGKERISNVQYFTKVIQQFIHLMQDITQDGFVFRVDLRLRPNGESGALVSSIASLETYYQEQGRDWERYAMVKARVIGHNNLPWFKRLITPFVYRRYIDFSVIESLRSMKSMIEREVQLNPRLNDIKRGLGGIREIEFIIQSIQLIRGGRLFILREQNTLTAMNAIGGEKLLSRTAALRQAYLFLRKLENFLQLENDQQTHELPKQELKRQQIALAMNYESWEALEKQLNQYQRIISTMFHLVLGQFKDYEDNNRLLLNQLSSVWQGHIENSMAVNLLQSLNYEEPERCYQLIYSFRHSPRCRRLTQAARLRLDKFMVLLLSELTKIGPREEILLQVIHLLENIVGRSAYLALLTENINSLNELLYWFVHSPFISDLLVKHPFLLEVLLEQDKQWQPLSRRQLKTQLNQVLQNSQEQEEDSLRQFKLTYWLLAARAEIEGYIDAIRIGQFLSDLAEVIVERVVSQACEKLAIKYPKITEIQPQFAIIAYGKLGSREMNYNSDLDLVFIYNQTVDAEDLIIRLTRKILHKLTTRTQFGILYSVDTRLRPSGEAGLLVSRLSAFLEYQNKEAWTWEYQALIKGRILIGNRYIRTLFYNLKKQIILTPRASKKVLNDVLAMRQKIMAHKETDEMKYDPGSLIDLEFLTQYLILAYPKEAFIRLTHTLRLLEQLREADIITTDQFHLLCQAYRCFHKIIHLQILTEKTVLGCEEEKKQVMEICKQLM